MPMICIHSHINLNADLILFIAKGDLFKAHKGTPRSENMIGSLVIIFPTDYQGGSFVLRQDGQE